MEKSVIKSKYSYLEESKQSKEIKSKSKSDKPKVKKMRNVYLSIALILALSSCQSTYILVSETVKDETIENDTALIQRTLTEHIYRKAPLK